MLFEPYKLFRQKVLKAPSRAYRTMFGKLKEKLKGALSLFSRKTAEAAEEKKEEPLLVEKKIEPVLKEKLPEDKKIEPFAQQQVKEKKTGTASEKKKEVLVKGRKVEVRTEDIKGKIPSQKDVPAKKEEEREKKVTVSEPEKVEVPLDVAKETLPEVAEKIEEKRGFLSKFKKTFSQKEERTRAGTNEEQKEQPYVPPRTPSGEESQEQQRVQPVEQPASPGFFGKLKQTFTTKTISADKFDELFWDLEIALLENNVSLEVIEKIKIDLKAELVDKPLPRDVEKKIQETLKNSLQEILSFTTTDLIKTIQEHSKPFIIAFFGINGSGKTTSIAKLTHYVQQQNLSVVLAAGDTFRAAAIQQLQEHADKLNVPMIRHDYGSDAAAVAYDAIKYAEKNKIDVVLIDTAGRLHSNSNLMAELEKIIRITKPHLKIFVGESITGNDCIEQAKRFNDLVDLDGSILTKADVDEKGGAPLSIAYTIKKPIFFMGVGQHYEDLELFDAKVILERLGL